MSNSIRTARRPILVWFISAFYIVAGLGTLGFCQLAFMGSVLPPGYLLAVAATALLTIVAAVALLFARRQAFPLFALALAAALVMYAWPFFQPREFPGSVAGRIVSAIVGLALMVAVLMYTGSLKNKGVLK